MGLGLGFGSGSGFGFGFGLGAPSRMPDSTTSRTASSTLLHGPCSVLGAEREGVGALPSQVSRRRTPSECRKDGTSSSSSQSGSHTGASTGAEHERFIAVREETRRRLGPRGMRGAWWSATLEPLITSIEPASAACDWATVSRLLSAPCWRARGNQSWELTADALDIMNDERFNH